SCGQETRYSMSTEPNIMTDSENPPQYTSEWYELMSGMLGAAACRQLGIYVVPDDFVLSIVIPVYNEEATLARLVERVMQIPLRKEVVLIDDCSQDGSRELLNEIAETYRDDSFNQVRLAFHDVNQGKGAALR